MKTKVPLSESQRVKRYRRYARAKGEDNGWNCAYCGVKLTPENYTADHVKPQSRGGKDAFHNIVLACDRCNSLKSDLSVYDFQALLVRRRKRTRGVRPAPAPNYEVWNPHSLEWMPLGAQNKKKVTEELLLSGKYIFR